MNLQDLRELKSGASHPRVLQRNPMVFEMWDDQGNDIDTSFLNFPAEEDFILYGPYSDKSLFNNVLTMDIANELGYYSSRTRFVELVLNGDYKGVYVIMEKVKRDGDRVDIATLRETELSGDDLTGGYIFRIDKGPHEGWSSKYNAYESDNPIFFQYYYPKSEIITAQQKSYIQDYTHEFEEAIASPTYRNSRGKHYLDYIDLRSFVDNFILNELSKNVDAYRLSSYFHKDKDSKGGKIIAGPYWDFNLAFGNGDYCGGDDATGWEYYQCVGSSPFWWDAMLKNPDFTNALRCRWVELRQTTLSTSTINTKLDAFVSELGESRMRNFQRWPIMGTYVWPNSWFYAQSANHDEVIGYMKQWIEERSIWMDENIPGSELECQLYEPPYVGLVTGLEDEATITMSIFPNPATDILNVSSDQIILEVSITSILGKPVLREFPNSAKFQLNLNSIQNKGIFLVQVKSVRGLQIQRIRIE